MSIISRYQSTCRECKGHIAVGEKIEWEKGMGAKHIVCKDQAEKLESPSYRGRCDGTCEDACFGGCCC
jgi:hypothetical protein